MRVSGLWVYWKTRGSLWGHMALEQSALARPLITKWIHFSAHLRPELRSRASVKLRCVLLLRRRA
jgi:hypothetical protein